MKICILSHCFYPSRKRGGPTVSVTNLAKLLAQHHQVSVITVGYEMGETTFYSSVNPGKNRLFDCDVYYLENDRCDAYYQVLNDICPDVIYVSSLFSWQYAVAAMAWRKKNKNTQVIIAPRGELMPAALARGSARKKHICGYVSASCGWAHVCSIPRPRRRPGQSGDCSQRRVCLKPAIFLPMKDRRTPASLSRLGS